MTEDKLADILAETGESVAQCAKDMYLIDYELLATQTSSPIERLLLAQLLGELHRYNYHLDYPKTLGEPAAFSRGCLIPQCRIGRYQVDFYLQLTPVAGVQLDARLVIECDGHDFHERTKEQAQHDRTRDRWFTTRGYIVMRFTGSEIFNDAERCATEIILCLLDKDEAITRSYQEYRAWRGDK